MMLVMVLCHLCFIRLCVSSLIDFVGSVALGEFCLLGHEASEEVHDFRIYISLSLMAVNGILINRIQHEAKHTFVPDINFTMAVYQEIKHYEIK